MAEHPLLTRIKGGEKILGASAYDALSAKLIEQAGFEAIATSGFAISAAYLGQPDVELYTMTENLEVVSRITAAVTKPVIADADTGYGNTISLMRTVREFARAGAAGILIEDQISPKRCPFIYSDVQVVPLKQGVNRIRAAVEARGDTPLIIIARTDAGTVEESIDRAAAYIEAGADLVKGTERVFRTTEALGRFKAAATTPVWLGVLGWLEDVPRDELLELGDFLSFPFVALGAAVQAIVDNLEALRTNGDVRQLPRAAMGPKALAGRLGKAEMDAVLARYDA